MHETGTKGDIGVSMVTADLLAQGLEVLEPVSSCSPYDLVVLHNSRWYKIQVKYVSKRAGSVSVQIRRAIIANSRIARRRARADEVDVAAIYCPETRECYYAAVKDFNCTIQLRIDPPPKSGGRNSKHWAKDYQKFPLIDAGGLVPGTAP